jgi:hypothetical protein
VVEEEDLEEEEADKDRASADHLLVVVQSADTLLRILVEHHAPV